MYSRELNFRKAFICVEESSCVSPLVEVIVLIVNRSSHFVAIDIETNGSSLLCGPRSAQCELLA